MATTADVWALWADFEQAIVDKEIDQWRKRLRAFIKAKEEHWTLAVIGCSLLCAAQVHCFKQYLNVSVIFVNTAFYAWRMIDNISLPADSNIMSAGCLLYTFYMQLQY